MQDEGGDEIADALDRLRADGWSIGDTASYSEAWRRALDRAEAVGLLPGRPRPAMG